VLILIKDWKSKINLTQILKELSAIPKENITDELFKEAISLMEREEGKKNLLKMTKRKLNSYLLTTLYLIGCSQLLGMRTYNIQNKHSFTTNPKVKNYKRVKVNWET